MKDSYSQYGEDKIIAAMFGDHKGLLLEIGAWNPRDLSNSRLLIERGWEAVLVEFSPMPVHCLAMEYGYNDKITIIQAAVTANGQPITQFDITENALSTATAEIKDKWAKAINYYSKLWVQTLSMPELLSRFFKDRQPDYVSIDTEGTSVDLAMALLETNCRPPVLVVEFDNALARITEKAQGAGYRVVSTNETNVILAL